VFHLTKWKYWFFAASGVVILPGLLALIFWGLNPGIDFTNGASIELRFAASASQVTTLAVANVFKAAGATDVQVLGSTDLSGGTPAGQYAYIRFSRPIGTSEAAAVLSKLQASSAKLPAIVSSNGTPVVHTLYTVSLPNKTTYGLMVVPFTAPVKASAIKQALATLPDTDAPPVTTTSQATPTAAATGAATAAPTTAPTATAAATATPSATATAAPSATTYPVSVSDVQLGQNNQTYTVETQTDFTRADPKHPQLSLDALVAQLQQQYGYAYVQAANEVGPAIASETALRAIFAVVLASAAILTYIAIAFRKVGSIRLSIRFGTCAIIALLHDALVVLGLWAIFGHLFDFKVDTLFVTAVLTVIGFSVHDTIVVFDRIRENLARRSSETFEQVVNASLVQTMSRSLNTSLTVLFTLTALTLIGGASIRSFTLALLIGIASGTYSSIFNASMLLVVWENGEWKRWPIVRSFVRQPAPPPVVRRDLARSGAR
jgi:preprotein translocase SecF subunit